MRRGGPRIAENVPARSDWSTRMSSVTHVPPRPIFFLHVPKTAGLSVCHWLGNHFPASRVYWIDHRNPRAELPRPLDDYDLVAGHACYRFTDRFARRPRVITFLRE